MEVWAQDQKPPTKIEEVVPVQSCYHYCDERWTEQTLRTVNEMALTVYVNQVEFVTLLCTPNKLKELLLGFLHLEGVITNCDDVAFMRICPQETEADIELVRRSVPLPRQRVLTSGCGGGISFLTEVDGMARPRNSMRLSPDQLIRLPNLLRGHSRLYPLSGGIHTSILSDGDRVLAIAEDIGRHNTLDKIDGECLLNGMPTDGRLIYTTGRISSEMLIKAAKMRVQLVASRTSPTHRAVALAEEMGITLVGYIRAGNFNVYTHPCRVEDLQCPKPAGGCICK